MFASVAPAEPRPEVAPGVAEPMLAMVGVSHRFPGVEAVNDVTLSVAPGELVCLLGPSGCGKTTVLRLAAGLEVLQRGQIFIKGDLVADPSFSVAPEDRGVGLVFQDYTLFPHLSVRDNVAFGLKGLHAKEITSRVDHVLAHVGMDSYAATFPHQLSGGQQQRVALARAVATRPRLMLLDEPFSGLDVTLKQQIRDDTLHVLKESGAATLMVTHDPEEAMFMADRVILMRAGEVAQEGPPVELYTHPRNAFVAGFFGEVNRMTAVVEGGAAQTALGPLAAKDLADGTRVEVLVRSEGLRIAEAPLCAPASSYPWRAEVLAARMLGRSSLVHILLEGSGEPLHLHARVPGRFLPEEGSSLAISLDSSQTFVFPLESA